MQVLLAIKDYVNETLSDSNILLANTNGVPEKTKGLNNLKHSVTVGVTFMKSWGFERISFQFQGRVLSENVIMWSLSYELFLLKHNDA